MYQFEKQPMGITLEELADQVDEKTESDQAVLTQVRVDMTSDDPKITFGDRELPVTERGIGALARFVNIPEAFFKRVDLEAQQFLLDRLVKQSGDKCLLQYNEGGLLGVYKMGQVPINPRRIVNTAAKVIDARGIVVDFGSTAEDFYLDAIVPEDFGKGIGGDPSIQVPTFPDHQGKERHVGDITRGGLRFGQNRRQNLAPYVQPYVWRLACTNGMEVPDHGLRVDMRGSTVDEVLAELEAAADRAFTQIEESIAAVYATRREIVDNPERTLRRMAREHGLSDRVTMRLIDSIPGQIEDGGQVSTFDLINIITNAANDPALNNRPGARRELQVAGGGIVAEHSTRCPHCKTKVSA